MAELQFEKAGWFLQPNSRRTRCRLTSSRTRIACRYSAQKNGKPGRLEHRFPPAAISGPAGATSYRFSVLKKECPLRSACSNAHLRRDLLEGEGFFLAWLPWHQP